MIGACSARRHDQGYLTLGALFGLIALGTVLLLTWHQVERSESAIALLISTDRAYHRALVSTFEQLKRHDGFPRGVSIETRYSKGRFGDSTVGITARIALNDPRLALTAPLLSNTLPGSTPFPFIDLDRLIGEPIACPEPVAAEVPRSTSGRSLTSGSLASSHTCRPPPLTLARGGSFRENIAVTRSALIESLAPSRSITLATPGFFEALSPLELRGMILLVAGGDLFVTALDASAPSTVTLVSATGTVVVERVSPRIRVRALGYAGVQLPANTNLSTDAPPPPLLERLLLGVRRGPP